MQNSASLIYDYFNLTSLEELERIRNEKILNRNFDLSRRIKNYRRYKSLLDKHSVIFKKIVNSRNQIAVKEGYSDYFDYIAHWDKIPNTSLSDFFLKYKKIALKFREPFISFDKNYDFLSTKYNSLDMSWIIDSSEFNLPDDVLDKLIKKYPKLKTFKNKIDFKNRPHRYYQAQYKHNTKKVTVVYDKSDSEVNSAILVAHEIGHAINYLKMFDQNKDPDDRENYLDEEIAVKAEIDFENTLNAVQKNASKDRVLYHFAKTLFEKKIYKNPDCDYSSAYAESINKVFPIKDKYNPFYVLDTSFIMDPCYSTNYSVLYAKMYGNMEQ